ncbi:MAG: PTS transporter subunit EIIB [Actinomycetaceae bacterium]|nr:PTS transporter subunit EIIB [Actinomycetaceae bacterium]
MSSSVDSTGAAIVAGLGGKPNIVSLEACITRLRVVVNDAAVVDEQALKAAGAFDVVMVGPVVQVVVGPQADDLADAIGQL